MHVKFAAIQTLPPVGKQKRYSPQLLTYIQALKDQSAGEPSADRLEAGDQSAGRRFRHRHREARMVRVALASGGVSQGNEVWLSRGRREA